VSETVRIAVIHMDIAHGAPERNRAMLVSLAHEAANGGAQIIVAPELAISGYSFAGREAVADYVEELEGQTFQALSAVAAERAVYCCAGFAETDRIGIYHNSAMAVGPNGQLVAHHRKRVCEKRWAAPGSGGGSVFDTPWGRVGMLICADTYYGILARSLALQGAELALVLANWPAGALDPRDIWRARCLENGFGLVAANRTGQDLTMDCRNAPCFALTPEGRVLLNETAPDTRIHLIDYPLAEGRFCRKRVDSILSGRSPTDYADISLDMNGMEDVSTLWGLPQPGTLNICALTRQDGEDPLDGLRNQVMKCAEPTVIVMPGGAPLSVHCLQSAIGFHPVMVCAQVLFPGEQHPCLALVAERQIMRLPDNENSIQIDFGPARVALVAPDALRHPEQSLALSKRGCDLLVTSSGHLDDDDRLVMGIKCIDRVAVAMAADNGAAVYLPPDGHSCWQVAGCGGGGSFCSLTVDTARLRKKHFMDRVDMGLLLERTGGVMANA